MMVAPAVLPKGNTPLKPSHTPAATALETSKPVTTRLIIRILRPRATTRANTSSRGVGAGHLSDIACHPLHDSGHLGAQPRAKCGKPAVQMCLHRSRRDPQCGRGLRFGETGEVTQGHHLTLSLRQAGH